MTDRPPSEETFVNYETDYRWRYELVSDQLTVIKASLAKVEGERDRLAKIVERVVFFGDALIAREYEPGSETIKELVESANAALSTKSD